MAPIKVGLIGYGTSTKVFHLPFIIPNPDLEVVAFLQRAEAPQDKSTAEKGTHCTIDHPNARHHRTAKDFFADEGIELVIVCTHTATHTEFAEQALLAGKHGQYKIDNCHLPVNLLSDSRRRKALHHNLARSRQSHRPREETAKSPYGLPESTLRLRLPHFTALHRSGSLGSNHRVLKPLRRRQPSLDPRLKPTWTGRRIDVWVGVALDRSNALAFWETQKRPCGDEITSRA